MRNLEIKLRLDDTAFAMAHARLRHAGAVERLRQVDTYFVVDAGRLKLRQSSGAAGDAAELIAYHRPDVSGPRWSSYERLSLTAGDAARLREMLAATAGIWTVVDKVRLVGLRQRSRIHLDEVSGLGPFLEIETVAADDAAAVSIDQELAATVEWLGVDLAATSPIAGSYADLKQSQSPKREGTEA